jgi:threonine dehydrogenase-like Zn-dependent dehydrogenase
MRALMSLVSAGRLNLEQLVTHRLTLEQIEEAYPLFSNQEDGVQKVAIAT